MAGTVAEVADSCNSHANYRINIGFWVPVRYIRAHVREKSKVGNRIKMECEMQESILEKRFRLTVKKYGGQALKFTSPGKRGVPDRLVLLPEGKAIFVEMKAPGKPLEPLQKKRADELRMLGFEVYKIDSISDIENFVMEVLN